MIDDDELDAFQTALIEALAGARALDDPALDAHRAWVRAFEPALTEASRTLIARWARRDEPPISDAPTASGTGA